MGTTQKRVLLLIETSRAFGRKLIDGISKYMVEHDSWDVDMEDRGIFEELPAWIRSWKGDGILTRSATLAQATLLRKIGVRRWNC